MGIPGIYKELGPGKRISLSKLTAQSFVTHQRPLRIAIDAAIWSFQNQAAEGGTNPALRNLFYRLARLLSTPVEPIFVFDGPNKPRVKRNKKVGSGGAYENKQAKKLISLFGFHYHDAPGEAEAECALLQQKGIVDAVLSEDVDTIMFGCTKTLRKWSSEGKGSSYPTHVSLYDVEATGTVGLDRAGMILVALMSGGDYHVEGIPACGPKIACEAARAGFGETLCLLAASDQKGIQKWRERLQHELQTNESKFFRTKHPGLSQNFPEEFPDMRVLSYYTDPVVSGEGQVDALKAEMEATHKRGVDILSLREFTRKHFGWNYRGGAIKYVRVLSQAIFVQNLLQQKTTAVHRISSRITPFNTDATPELRIFHVPLDVVPIDLSKEPEEPSKTDSSQPGLALNSDDEFQEDESKSNNRPANQFDVNKPCLASVLEVIAKELIPDTVASWEKTEKAKAEATLKKKTNKKKKKKAETLPNGTLDGYVQFSKNLPKHDETRKPLPRSSTTAAPKADLGTSQAKPFRWPKRLPSSKPPEDSSPVQPSSPAPSSPTRPSVPPKPTKAAEDPVLISSSPGMATSPVQPPSLKGSEPLPFPVQESPRKDSRHMIRRQKPPAQQLLSNRKQSEIDAFLVSKKPVAAPEPVVIQLEDSDEEPALLPTALTPTSSVAGDAPPAMPSPVPPQKRGKESVLGDAGLASSPLQKKKGYIPRTSEPGYFTEVDLHEAEGHVPAEEAGKDSLRIKDVDIIDLREI